MIDFTKEYWTHAIEEMTGEEIMMNTPDCVIYKLGKDTCKGCQHELNCAKLSGVMSIVHSMTCYKPKDFSDHLRTEQQASTLIDQVTNAKSVEEIEKFMRGEKE